MKRLIGMALLASATVLLWVDSSSAFNRRRCRPCPPCPCWCPAQFVDCQPIAPAAAPTQIFTSKGGRKYRISFSLEPSYEFETRRVFPPGSAPPGPDDFIGNDRMVAKTSIASGPNQTFAPLGDLLYELITNHPDDQMRNRNPPMKRDPDFDRVAEENRNVTVPAWLYAVKKEDNDHDYHLIVGSDPNSPTIRYMNMEISALPLSGPNRDALRVPTQALKDFLQNNNHLIGSSGYLRFEDPVPIRVSGSLFYDIDHAPGIVGSFKEPRRVPDTAWEVHPVTEIVFEP